jgi:hypothetical protein
MGAGTLLLLGVDVTFGMRRAFMGPPIEVKSWSVGDGRTKSMLLIDRIAHGAQYRNELPTVLAGVRRVPWERVPTMYYHRQGPIGIAFSKLDGTFVDDVQWQAADAIPAAILVADGATFGPMTPWAVLCGAWSEPPVGVVMLNAGTVAAYARPFQTIDFYESNPTLREMSVSDPLKGKFTYVAGAEERGARIRVFPGNERKTFDAESPKRFYHLVIVDIARGTDVSTDLMTKEALKSFFDASVEEGVACVHVSHRFCDLWKPIVSAADSLGFATADYLDSADNSPLAETGHASSEWILVARKPEYLPRVDPGRTRLIPNGVPLQATFRGGLRIRQLQAGREFMWADQGPRSLEQIRRQP